MKDVVQTAKQEIEEELFRKKVEIEKERLRKKRPFLHKIFPFKIVRR